MNKQLFIGFRWFVNNSLYAFDLISFELIVNSIIWITRK